MEGKKNIFVFLIAVNIINFLIVLLFCVVHGTNEIKEKTSQYSNLSLRSLRNFQNVLVDHTHRMFQEWEEDIKSNPKLAENPCESKVIQTLTDVDPPYIFYGVVGTNSKILCGKNNEGVGRDVSERVYIQEAIQNKKMAAGTFQVGKITGKPSLNFGYPVLDSNGKVTSVLVLAIGLENLNKRLEEYSLPKGSELVITDFTGTVLIHYPDKEQVGKQEFNTELFSVILSQKKGSLITNGSDGTKKIFTYEPFFKTHENVPDSFVILGLPYSSLQLPIFTLILQFFILQIVIFIIEVIFVIGYRKAKRLH